jgi:hypothetical protein
MDSPVERRGDRDKRQIHVVEGFGVAYEHIAARHEMMREFAEDAFLRGPVEVDDHVTAEDGVGALGDAIVGIHEIEAAKLDETAQLRGDPDLIGAGVAAAHEVFAVERGGYGRYYIV